MAAAHPEYEMLVGLRAGLPDAFDAVYRMYFHPIYCNAVKITRNASAAEDIVQDVFITLWEKRQDIDCSRSIGGWLFVLCYNKSLSCLRKSLRSSVVLEQYQHAILTVAGEGVLTDPGWEVIENGMAQLSPQKRKVFQLCKLEGRTYEEAARELQLSKHTVKEYLSASIVLLKEHAKQHVSASAAAGASVILLLFFYLS